VDQTMDSHRLGVALEKTSAALGKVMPVLV
jgi:hypothetical protein